MNKKTYSVEVGGKELTAEFNDLADQADGSVMVRYGNTVVLATAVMSKKPKSGMGFFPLTVDYEERFYAAGEILGSRFMRREGRPTDEAVLSGRIVDRTIRPLFDQSIRNEIQVVITVLSIDEDDPDVLGVIAASLAIGTSDIPWNGPVSAVRIAGLKDGSHSINPTYEIRSKPDSINLDLFACGKDGAINMIEVGGKEVEEDIVSQTLKKSSEEIEKIQSWQKTIIDEIGKEKREVEKPSKPEGIEEYFKEAVEPKLFDAVFSGPGKKNIEELKEEWFEKYAEKFEGESISFADEHYEEAVNDLLHKEAIENGRRPDGRGFDEVRPLFAQAGGISPILHGSGIFYRGGTHILSTLTLGGPQDAQIIDSMETREGTKRFLHHYNFPPFSVGETGRIGGTNRRMVGHGALAEKALSAVIPPKEVFPYTIRMVSEALASNGSTSMGSVCASSLALQDGGVPISAPVAGIASGLMMDEKGNYKVLTDIQGPEDHHGDMDFKVAGTEKGITAIQMDVKVNGISLPVLEEALAKARAARLTILETMKDAIKEPRKEISPRAPKIITITIKPKQIGMVIGSGGKTINEIKESTGAEIDIEDDGTVFITGKDGGAEKAQKIIEEMTREYTAGDKFEGVVTKIADFGAFVRIGHNTEGLVHISEIAPFRVDRVGDILAEGDKVPVVVKEVDTEKGKIRLSIKDIDPNFAKQKKGM
ncbi:MAG: polyribonucleotide nucleotidyltransferase [Parcubacteria group bacterium CG11_big_fil_rev_8_21_14_0_20_39_22]|nr:MAG: polyribonucleotide nucleotidyltransferase [Parcubacteria group bacterium CG11_big_fil_rev_8_21_14_0_20_39_22]